MFPVFILPYVAIIFGTWSFTALEELLPSFLLGPEHLVKMPTTTMAIKIHIIVVIIIVLLLLLSIYNYYSFPSSKTYFLFVTLGNSNATASNGLSGISSLYGLPSHSPSFALYLTTWSSFSVDRILL